MFFYVTIVFYRFESSIKYRISQTTNKLHHHIKSNNAEKGYIGYICNHVTKTKTELGDIFMSIELVIHNCEIIIRGDDFR